MADRRERFRRVNAPFAIDLSVPTNVIYIRIYLYDPFVETSVLLIRDRVMRSSNKYRTTRQRRVKMSI